MIVMQTSPEIKAEYVLLGLGAVGLAAYWYFFLRKPELPYECTYCGARFATFGELETHIAAEHPGEPIPLTLEIKVVEA